MDSFEGGQRRVLCCVRARQGVRGCGGSPGSMLVVTGGNALFCVLWVLWDVRFNARKRRGCVRHHGSYDLQTVSEDLWVLADRALVFSRHVFIEL